MNTTESHRLLDELLTEAAREATGRRDVEARPGQVDLAHGVLDSLLATSDPSRATNAEHVEYLASAPTGTGKALGYLAPVFLDAVTHGHRAVIATESLALQAQLVDKDAPAAARASLTVLGSAPRFALLKGWSNYGCALKAAALIHDNVPGAAQPAPERLGELARVSAAAAARADAGEIDVDGTAHRAGPLLALASWVTGQAAGSHTGDRDTYPDVVTRDQWETVSTTPEDCMGAQRCPLAQVCLPRAAKERAAQADVVITNHSMLAVQAANAVPVVLGSKALGDFDHVVLDEAHALPGAVRSAGARGVSAYRVMRLIDVVHRHCATTKTVSAAQADRAAQAVVDQGFALASALDRELDALIAPQRGRTRFGSAILGLEDQVVLPELGAQLDRWAKAVRKVLPSPEQAEYLPAREGLRVLKSRAVVQKFIADLADVLTPGVGQARWVEDGNVASKGRWIGVSVQCSPVDVSLAIANNLWCADAQQDFDDDGEQVYGVPEYRWVQDPGENAPPRYRLSVTGVSATLPSGFARSVGMSAPVVEHPSPFDEAYAASALYIPLVTDPVAAAGFTRTWAGKVQFDTSGHASWAAGQVCELVRANDGRALVLATTTTAGQAYVAALRAQLPDLTVLSQWEGESSRRLVARWRGDERAVLVGTRSLMTGVDAAGQTCSLVVIDRVPRDAGNPVDDARVKVLVSQGVNKWVASRLVYGAEAALRIAQSEGRLIRSMSDVGMVACLDPRMLKWGVVTYDEQTRQMYMKSLYPYGQKFTSLEEATRWLREHRARHTTPA